MAAAISETRWPTFARASATISTERRVGIGGIVCCHAAVSGRRRHAPRRLHIERPVLGPEGRPADGFQRASQPRDGQRASFAFDRGGSRRWYPYHRPSGHYAWHAGRRIRAPSKSCWTGLRSGMPCATSSSAPLSSARSWSCAVGRANGAIANLRRIRGQHLCNAGSELTGWE